MSRGVSEKDTSEVMTFQRKFNGSNLAYCSRTEAPRGRFRKSLSGAQRVEQRLSLLQIERVETFGEAAVDGG